MFSVGPVTVWNVGGATHEVDQKLGARQVKPIVLRLGRDLHELPFQLVINGIASGAWCPTLGRSLLYRLFGLGVGPGVAISPGVFVKGRHLRVGGWTSINARCILDCSAEITIGRDCGIAYWVSLITANHDASNPLRRSGTSIYQAITIGSGVWIGSGATILPGVTIGDGAVIAAGAVVTTDCDPHTLYGGIPARPLRELNY